VPAVSAPGLAELERLTARSWRALEEEPYGDWLLRAGGGFTGRANSVLVLGEPPDEPARAVAAVGEWYAARGLPPRAQVPMPGADLADAAFDRAGWARDEDVLVLTAPVTDWRDPRVPVDLAPTPDDAWLTGYRYRGTPLPPVAHAVLVNADAPVFAAIRLDPAPAPLAAVARGVLVDGWLCVTAVTVDEAYRRRGLATAVMAGLGAWARTGGGHSCVLQVASSNAPALALYDRLGFTEHHRYHYRSGPPPTPRPGAGAARRAPGRPRWPRPPRPAAGTRDSPRPSHRRRR
jgi:GNAT superfamily N-acetyltransferase